MKTKQTLVLGVLMAVLFGIGSVLAQSQFGQHLFRAQRSRPGTALRPPPPPPPPRPDFGSPLPGLTPDQLAAFADGREEFENEETVASGLGPIFNNVSCVACHSGPAVGGSSDIVVTRFGRTVNGVFDPLTEKGGSLLQQFSIDPAARETVPPEANTIARRRTTPLFGLGLIEAIPDDAIRQGALRQKPDGVTGRISEVTDITTGQVRVGRFGWKAQQATLLAFSADAYLNEMGITSRFFPKENAPNGNQVLLALFDTTQDPEDEADPATGRADIDANADFMRFLGAPPRLPLSPSARAGEPLFAQIGCAVCHTPLMQTGPNRIAALDRKPVWLFSDLLLHDMGTLGDGIAQGAAKPREMRTAPLWGLRASPPYLHDGRAPTVHDAIAAHEGEGRVSRDRYLRLTLAQRRQLLDYLAAN
ncbi:hypothetical protein LBMAG56_23190 [Verrucomicrobiota bacterium]|nr:hypothetical protein LBMAG56_23190 [Verrucomicrobiota bacterium]